MYRKLWTLYINLVKQDNPLISNKLLVHLSWVLIMVFLSSGTKSMRKGKLVETPLQLPPARSGHQIEIERFIETIQNKNVP